MISLCIIYVLVGQRWAIATEPRTESYEVAFSFNLQHFYRHMTSVALSIIENEVMEALCRRSVLK